MAADAVGEIVFRIIGKIVLELFLFRVCRVINWLVLKIFTLGVFPAGVWRDQKKEGWVSWFGLSIVVGAFILFVLKIC